MVPAKFIGQVLADGALARATGTVDGDDRRCSAGMVTGWWHGYLFFIYKKNNSRQDAKKEILICFFMA